MSLVDNRTQLQDCENVTEVAGEGSADPQSNTAEAGFVIQGAGAMQFQVTNAQEYITYDLDSAGSAFSLDLSDSTVYIMVKDNLHESFANLGAQIVLDDGADGAGGDCIGYNVAGFDVIGLPYEKKYSGMKLDVSVVVATPGTDGVDYFQYNGTEAGLDHAAILQVGYGSIHLAKAQGTIPNAWFDGIYYIANGSYAATVSGGTVGTPETMADLVGDDIAVGAGMFSNPIGTTYYIFAPTQWGDTGTGSSYFTGTDETWLYLGNNGGGHAVGATHFPMRLVGNATGTNSFTQTRVINQNVGTRAEFDFSNVNFDLVQLDTCSFIDFGAITFPLQDADKFCNATTFINCAQMDWQSLDMDGCTVIGSTDANGAIIWNTDDASEENQDNITFVSGGTGHAIYITAPGTYNINGYVFSGYAAQGGTATDRAIYNNSGGAVTINVSSGATPSYRDGAGATTTVNNNVTVTFSGLIANTEVRVYATAGGAELAGVENSTTSFGASVSGGTSVYYTVHHRDYEHIRVEGFIWPAAATTLPIQQRLDRNYINN